MTTTTRRVRAAGVALLLGLAAVAGPTAAAERPALPLPCAGTPGAQGTGGDALLTTTAREGGGKGKGKGLSRAEGALSTFWTLAGASCPGASYVLTVRSVDGSKLGWQTTSAQAGPSGTVLAPSPLAQTQTAGKGAVVTVTLPGDGVSSVFSVEGATSGSGGCVQTTVQVVGPDGTVLDTSTTLDVCPELPGGSSYW